MAFSLTEAGIGFYSLFLTILGGNYFRSQNKKIDNQDKKLETKVDEKLCIERHANLEKGQEEIKNDVKDIKSSIITIEKAIIEVKTKMPNMNGK